MNWYKLSNLSKDRMYDIQVQLIHATQLVAAVGHSLAVANPDDSHTAMIWSTSESALICVEIPGDVPFSVGLCVADLSLFITTNQVERRARYALHGRTQEEGLEWIQDTLAHLNLSDKPLDTIVYDYDPLPPHPVAQGESFNAADLDALAESVKYFDNTESLLSVFSADKPLVSSPVIWPHHFDMAIEIPIDEAVKDGTTIGLGYCTVDETYAEPYLYLAAYPYIRSENPPKFEGLGVWNNGEKWTGAALPMLSCLNENADMEQVTALTFLQNAYTVTREAIPKK
jgi:hypothetical protein